MNIYPYLSSLSMSISCSLLLPKKIRKAFVIHLFKIQISYVIRKHLLNFYIVMLPWRPSLFWGCPFSNPIVSAHLFFSPTHSFQVLFSPQGVHGLPTWYLLQTSMFIMVLSTEFQIHASNLLMFLKIQHILNWTYHIVVYPKLAYTLVLWSFGGHQPWFSIWNIPSTCPFPPPHFHLTKVYTWLSFESHIPSVSRHFHSCTFLCFIIPPILRSENSWCQTLCCVHLCISSTYSKLGWSE